MQLSFRDSLSHTRDATSLIVDNNDLREALRDSLNDDFVIARCHGDDNAKARLYKIKLIKKINESDIKQCN
jgi:hypothetical protein